MPNPEGTPIWYELLTNDEAASAAFYEAVLGWKLGPPAPGAGMKYSMLDSGRGYVGGMMQLTDEMRSNGAKPTWLFYIGVEDVDASVKKVEDAGGKILMRPFDIPNVGRLAMIADPQGIPLYVMRGATSGTSTAFERHGMGKCSWNELATPDQKAAHAFYEKVFGWKYPDKMAMPGMGDYVFVAASETTIGATMTQTPGAPSGGWQFYFRTSDVDAAVERLKLAGGKVHAGPMEVPTGERVVVASDVHGIPFGIVAGGS
jgi:predicted enzyme related to lactoylglutathione lyase